MRVFFNFTSLDMGRTRREMAPESFCHAALLTERPCQSGSSSVISAQRETLRDQQSPRLAVQITTPDSNWSRRQDLWRRWRPRPPAEGSSSRHSIPLRRDFRTFRNPLVPSRAYARHFLFQFIYFFYYFFSIFRPLCLMYKPDTWWWADCKTGLGGWGGQR